VTPLRVRTILQHVESGRAQHTYTSVPQCPPGSSCELPGNIRSRPVHLGIIRPSRSGLDAADKAPASNVPGCRAPGDNKHVVSSHTRQFAIQAISQRCSLCVACARMQVISASRASSTDNPSRQSPMLSALAAEVTSMSRVQIRSVECWPKSVHGLQMSCVLTSTGPQPGPSITKSQTNYAQLRPKFHANARDNTICQISDCFSFPSLLIQSTS